SLAITFLDSPGDQISLTSFFPNGLPISGIRIQYGDGQEALISPSDLQLLTLAGTAYGDYIQAYAGDDVIDALAGDDFVDAGAGDDIIFGGEGNDVINAGVGNDTLDG